MIELSLKSWPQSLINLLFSVIVKIKGLPYLYNSKEHELKINCSEAELVEILSSCMRLLDETKIE